MTIEAIDDASGAIENINEIFTDLTGTLQLVTDYADDLAASADDLIAAMDDTGDAAEEMGGQITDAMDGLEEASGAIADVDDSLETLSGGFDETGEQADSFGGIVTTAMGTVEDSVESLTEVAESALADVDDSFDATADQVEDSVDIASEALDAFGEAAADTATEVASSADDMSDSFDTVSDTTSDTAETISDSLDSISDATTTMAETSEASTDTTGDAFKAMAGAVDDSLDTMDDSVKTASDTSVAMAATVSETAKSVASDDAAIADSTVDMAKTTDTSAESVNAGFDSIGIGADKMAASVKASVAESQVSLDALSSGFNETATEVDGATSAMGDSQDALVDKSAVSATAITGAQDTVAANAEKTAAETDEAGTMGAGGLEKEEAAGAGAGAEAGGGSALGHMLGIAAVAGFGYSMYKQSEMMQSAESEIADNLHKTTKQVQGFMSQISSAQKGSEYSTVTWAQSLAENGGQLDSVYGKAFKAKEAIDYLKESSRLASGTDQNMADSSEVLADALTALHPKLSDIGSATTDLINIYHETGMTSFSQFDMILQRLGSKFSGTGISMKNFTGLLLDMQHAGVQGNRGLMTAATAVGNLIHPTEQTATTLKQMGFPLKLVEGHSINLAKVFEALRSTMLKLPPGMANVNEAWASQVAEVKSSILAGKESQVTAKGQVESLNAITAEVESVKGAMGSQVRMALAARYAQQELTISQEMVQLKTQKQTATLHLQESALQMYEARLKKAQLQLDRNNASTQLFGENSDVMNSVIMGSKSQFADYVKEANNAHDANLDVTNTVNTVAAQMRILRATFDSFTANLGMTVIPKVLEFAQVAMKVVTAIVTLVSHHKILRDAIIATAIAMLLWKKVLGGTSGVMSKYRSVLNDVKNAQTLFTQGGEVFKAKMAEQQAATKAQTGTLQQQINQYHKNQEAAAKEAEKNAQNAQKAAQQEGKAAQEGADASTNASNQVQDAQSDEQDSINTTTQTVQQNADATQESADQASSAVQNGANQEIEAQNQVNNSLAEGNAAAEEHAAVVTEQAERGAAGVEEGAAVTDEALEGESATAEATGSAMDAAMGPVGIALMVLIPIIQLVIKHWKAIAHFFETVWHEVEKLFMDGVEFVRKWWLVLAAILISIEDPFSAVILLVIKFHKQLIHFFEMIWHDIVDIVKDLWHDVVDFFEGLFKDVVDLVANLWRREEEGWEHIYDTIVKWAKEIWHDVVNIFTNLWHDMVHIGSEIIHGIVDGAKKGFDDVKKFFGHVGHDILHFISDPLSIASPSRVMADEVGAPIVQGIAVGMQKELPKVDKLVTTAIHDYVSGWHTAAMATVADTDIMVESIERLIMTMRRLTHVDQDASHSLLTLDKYLTKTVTEEKQLSSVSASTTGGTNGAGIIINVHDNYILSEAQADQLAKKISRQVGKNQTAVRTTGNLRLR